MSKTIVICSSGSFYKHCNEIADELRAKGFKVVVPATAERMKKKGDYDISKVKKWLDNDDLFHIKQNLANGHFDEVV